MMSGSLGGNIPDAHHCAEAIAEKVFARIGDWIMNLSKDDALSVIEQEAGCVLSQWRDWERMRCPWCEQTFLRNADTVDEDQTIKTLSDQYHSNLAEIERLRAELFDLLDTSMRDIAYECRSEVDGHKGWWDTCANSTALEIGERLVELGTWERHPDGQGRRAWFRPKALEGAEGSRD